MGKPSTQFPIELTMMAQAPALFEEIGVAHQAALRAATNAIDSLWEEQPVPAPRRVHARGSVLQVSSLMKPDADTESTAEVSVLALFDESTAVDELTNTEQPPWLA